MTGNGQQALAERLCGEGGADAPVLIDGRALAATPRAFTAAGVARIRLKILSFVWSVATDDGRRSVNQLLLQPFVNHNFPDAPGRYLSFAPVITADWEANSEQR